MNLQNATIVKNIKERNLLVAPKEDEIVYCKDESQYFSYVNNEWIDITSQSKVSGTIELSKRQMFIDTIQNCDPIDPKNFSMEIFNWIKKHGSTYYLLYGRELGYFSFFIDESSKYETAANLRTQLFECLNDVGEVLYIESDFDKDNQIIFWIKTPENMITEVYLFDCTQMIIPFTEV